MSTQVNFTFHRDKRRVLSSLLSNIRKSNFFLTAKGKLVDTYELHSFGVGLLMGVLTGFIPQELRLGYWSLILVMLSVALGIEGLREKPHEKGVTKKIKDKLPLRGQIRKEGQYFILGLVSGLIISHIMGRF